MNKLQLPFMRVLHNTLVNITNEHMGSQSVLFEGTVVHVHEYKGSHCIHLLYEAWVCYEEFANTSFCVDDDDGLPCWMYRYRRTN